MPIALVSETEYRNASSYPVVVSPVTAAVGDVLVAIIHLRTGATVNSTAISDTAGNAWAQQATDVVTGANTRAIIFTSTITAALNAGTVTMDTGAAYASTVNISRWSGVGGIDGAASKNQAAATTPTAANVTTTDPGDVVIGGISYASATAPTTLASGWTALTGASPNTGYYGANAYKLPGTTGTYGPSWTIPSAASASVTVALKPATTVLTKSGTLALTGAGTIAANGSPTTAGTSALTGSGQLSTSGTPTTTGAATTAGVGTLTLAGRPAAAATLTLANNGTLTASGTATAQAAIALTSDGTLTLAGGIPARPKNITVKAWLEPRRWAATTPARTKTATLQPRRWAGTL